MKAWLARLHTWVGVIVGIQLVVWLGSGLLMGLLDPEAVSGERTRAQASEMTQDWPERAVAPEAIVARSASKVLLVERTWRLQRPVWRVQTQAGTWLADARTGARWTPSREEILRFAREDYSGPGRALSPQRWAKAPLEARGHEGPVWQVDFDDAAGTSLYIDAQDAAVLERRNDTWRVFDIAWTLHIMDYTGREDFNHPLIVTFAVAGLWMTLSGLWLLGYAIKAGHLRPRWLAQRIAVPIGGAADAHGSVLSGRAGETVLVAFARSGRPLPSRCGGGQTCGLCVVRSSGAAPISDGDRRLLTSEELQAGLRLGCTLPISEGLRVDIIESGTRPGWQEAVVEQVRGCSASLREIVLRPVDGDLSMRAGSYVLIEIPAYRIERERWITDTAPVPTILLDHVGKALVNSEPLQRAYSPSLTPQLCDGRLPLLVRLDVEPDRPMVVGRGTAWLFSLQPGARVRYMGPFGDFRLRPSAHEKIFIGGGAGMAPLRAMLWEALQAGGKERIHFWYGARRAGEVPYEAELRSLAAAHDQFDFHVVYSEDDNGGFGPRWVHEAVHEGLLRSHGALAECEFYLCGPPAMLKATRELLAQIGVTPDRVAFDDFDA
ncbi:2Fe-2S iron-sulfur cluster-binding protein [Lysobacter humi (ex Lee et al. 2017)]